MCVLLGGILLLQAKLQNGVDQTHTHTNAHTTGMMPESDMRLSRAVDAYDVAAYTEYLQFIYAYG